jgi:hypothetical protein
MIRFGNGGVVAFFHKTRLPRLTPLPLFYLIQLAETKVLMVLGPITDLLFSCIVDHTLQVNLQAELTNISNIGLPYFYLSVILAVGILGLIALRYVFFYDVLFKPEPTQSSNN